MKKPKLILICQDKDHFKKPTNGFVVAPKNDVIVVEDAHLFNDILESRKNVARIAGGKE